MTLANTSFDYIKLNLKHVVNTLESHLHMQERELVGCCGLLFSYPIRVQVVDLFLSLSIGKLAFQSCKKCYKYVHGHPRSKGAN